MFIYADETGHSGKNIFAPPRYYQQGAILSLDDIEPIIAPVLNRHKALPGISEVHAAELRDSAKVNQIALELMEVLDSGTVWQFSVTTIEKPYLATTKFVDSVFDAGENLGARWFWYNTQFFRHVLCCLIDDMLTPRNRQRFWEAYLADDREGLKASVRNAQTYLDRFTKDRRLINVVLDAFRFALQNPEELTLMASLRKNGQRPHAEHGGLQQHD